MTFKQLSLGARFTINFMKDNKIYTKINNLPFHYPNAQTGKEFISVHGNTSVEEIRKWTNLN